MSENIYNLEIFKWVDHDVIDHIINNCEQRKYFEWERIITEWEKSNWEGYIIKYGRVSINIKEKKIAELSSGDIFGEIALLNEEERTASVIALENIEAIILSYDNLIDMINNDENKINKTIMNRIDKNLSML